LGIGLLLGYNVGVNFDAPYLATNIRDFWHRWHISLSTWLRDYLYFSLGGNRRGFKAVNLFLTQLLGGLWHGAHPRYVIWGAGHGLALVVSHWFNDRRKARERELEESGLRPWQRPSPRFQAGCRFLGWLVTFNLVNLLWIFFRAEDSQRAWEVLRAAVNFRAGGAEVPLPAWGMIGLTLLMQLTGPEGREFFLRVQARFSSPALAVWCAFWVVIILKLGPAGVLPFIYFQY
jgi:D-alanyl-lipoteichoic acid acyltransferase DltB (MBOAT superfamily)